MNIKQFIADWNYNDQKFSIYTCTCLMKKLSQWINLYMKIIKKKLIQTYALFDLFHIM